MTPGFTVRVHPRPRSARRPPGAAAPTAANPVGAAGFTLVELMIVIGIMAVVMAMGMPSILQTIKKEPLRQAVSDLVEGLEHARAQAILEGAPAEFVLRAADGLISVVAARDSDSSSPGPVPEDGGDAAAAALTTAEVRPFSARLHPDVLLGLVEVNLASKMEAEEVRVRFYPNGTSDEFTLLI
jgi:prepilin-type N-terminal cleavage/methylation domain-containing protein